MDVVNRQMIVFRYLQLCVCVSKIDNLVKVGLYRNKLDYNYNCINTENTNPSFRTKIHSCGLKHIIYFRIYRPSSLGYLVCL